MMVRSSVLRAVSPRRAGRTARRGALLLEALVSLALLVFGMAYVGLQISNGMRMAREAEIGTKAVMLADTKLAELRAGVLRPEKNDDELRGDFGSLCPGYTWRVKVEQTETDGLLALRLDIGYSEAGMAEQLENPDRSIDIEDSGTRIVQTAYRLMPIPADVDLARDFGLSEDELEKLTGAGQGQEGGGAGGEFGGGLADLVESLGGLSALQNFDPRDLANLPPEQFEQISALLEKFLGRDALSNLQSPEDQLRDVMNQERGRGGREGRGRGGRARGEGRQREQDRFGDRDDADMADDGGTGGRRRGEGRENAGPNRGRGGDRDEAGGARGGNRGRGRNNTGRNGNDDGDGGFDDRPRGRDRDDDEAGAADDRPRANFNRGNRGNSGRTR